MPLRAYHKFLASDPGWNDWHHCRCAYEIGRILLVPVEHVRFGSVNGCNDQFCIFEKAFPGYRQGHAIVMSCQKQYADLFFQQLHFPAECGLGDMEFFRCMQNGFFFGNNDKLFQRS